MEMKNDNINDTFLADWLAGNLTDEQLRNKITDKDFEAYLTLRRALNSVEIKNPDVEANYAAVKAKKIAALDQKQKARAIPLYKYAAIAASILVLLGLFNVFVFSNRLATGFGETAGVLLSENSEVTLNAKSEISYPNFFAFNRKIKLDGEAFFEVSKGSKFTVETAYGDVEVLGTKFNVISRGGVFQVVCHEGKVKVCTKNVTKILRPGDAVRFYANQTENWQTMPTRKPLWRQRESGFHKMPLAYVIAELENQYNTTIEYPKALQSIRFTGSFTHENLATALQSVCVPMHLNYMQTNGKIIISE
jgi:ferric-dicitrate binding protein FerR (iron transport regulator)